MRLWPIAGLFLAFAAAPAPAMTIASADFTDGSALPLAQVYTRCGGLNISPELHWSGAPSSARSLAVTMIDHDVPPDDWSHWIVVGIPVTASGLARGAAALPAGAHGVISNMGDAAYDGPCPPKGAHRYEITVWALPTPTIDIAADAKAKDVTAELLRAAVDHASITGTVTP
jgi:Raf kinase inhibitor-like YbhB/YbcL family protein